LFASPWIVGFVLLTVVPMLMSIVLSFTQWNGLHFSQIEWIGFGNYIRAVNDEKVSTALWNTMYYSFISVPLGLSIALGLAMLLNQKIAGVGVFRTLFYMPSIIGGVATIMMWLWIFQPQFGLLNTLLRGIADGLASAGVISAGWEPPAWLNDPAWAKPAMILMNVWTAGGSMLIFLAALQDVSPTLYEAARIDGASSFKQFIHVTLPQISPAIYFNLVMGVIGSLQVFNEAYLMTGGGPRDATLFFVLYLYQKGFADFEFGYASALAWILFAMICAFTALVVRSSALWVYYEGDAA